MAFVWNIPTKILFGAGKLGELHKEAPLGKKALIVISNGRSTKTNGSLDKLQDELKLWGADFVVYNKIGANPTEPVVQEGVEFGRANGCDFVCGLGGGSVLDAAKAIASVIPQTDGGRVWDYIMFGTGGKKPLTAKALPYVAITTSAGTGSEVDAGAVITNLDTNEKTAFFGSYPTLAIVDPVYMLTVPKHFTAYQGFDAFFHNAEGYISNACNEASAMIELTAISKLAKYLPIAVNDGKNLEARTQVAFANTLGGFSMDVCVCTAEHSLEHALSAYHPELPHGAGLIMISLAYFGHFVEKHACDEKFIDMARAMGKVNATKAEDFIDALKEMQAACGVDNLKMSDYGISPDEFPKMVQNTRDAMGFLLQFDPAPLTNDDMLNIYKKSYR
ncbi:MAG: iron-containing alcohol dehydrogenase [Selenomonadaceae bacterium]|nr:iron-containing alcohol dehydrogenase [Selenomonadaceae bacterium]